MRYAVVLAGGWGERLWPMSRRDHPKQLLPLRGERTLLAETLERIEPLVEAGKSVVITSAAIRARVLDRWGVPVVNPTNVTIVTDGAEALGSDADGSSIGLQLLSDPAGWLRIDLRPGLEIGTGTLTLKTGDAETEIKLELVPPARPLMITGVGHVGVGAAPEMVASAAQEIDPELGIVITYVTPDGPAAEAGVVRGDILQEIAGETVHDVGDLASALAEREPGDQVELTILHGDDLRTCAKALAPHMVQTTLADYVRLPRFAYMPELVNYRELPAMVHAGLLN